MASLDECCGAVLNLGKGQWISRIILSTYHFVWTREPLTAVGDEFLVIRPRHCNVYVVVPGDKSVVANGSEHRAGPYIIGQLMLAARGVDGSQNGKRAPVKFGYIIVGHRVAGYWSAVRRPASSKSATVSSSIEK